MKVGLSSDSSEYAAALAEGDIFESERGVIGLGDGVIFQAKEEEMFDNNHVTFEL